MIYNILSSGLFYLVQGLHNVPFCTLPIIPINSSLVNGSREMDSFFLI